MRRRLTVLVACVFTIVGVPSAATGSAVGEKPIEHCVVVAVGQAADGELITTEPECFPDLEAAVAFRRGFGARASFTLGTHYDGPSGSGSSISVVGSNCGGGYWNTPPSWDNRISSTRNGCNRVKHHDLAGASGSYASTWGVGVLSNVPSWMNNRAESVSYWTS